MKLRPLNATAVFDYVAREVNAVRSGVGAIEIANFAKRMNFAGRVRVPPWIIYWAHECQRLGG